MTLGVLDDGQVIEEVPCPWGTHGILMVLIDGKRHWIDTTVAMAPWDWLPRSDRDRQAYLTRRGEILLLRTPPYTVHDNRIEQTTFVAVQGDGTSICTRSMFYHGGVALGRRESWVDATPGERRRYIMDELQDAHPHCMLDLIAIPEKALTDWDRSVQAQVRFVIPQHFSGKTVKEGSVTDSAVWRRIIAYRPRADRTLPLDLGAPFESLHLYVIQLPPAYRFDGFPSDREAKSAWGSYRLTVKADEKDPRRLALIMHTKLTRTVVEPSEFADFRTFTEELKGYRVWLSARPTTAIEDAGPLEALLAVAPGSDTFAARTLARLYLDHKRGEDARRVLDTACFHHPRDAEMWALRIEAARDDADNERVHEALIRYFPEEPKYALALAGAKLKRSRYSSARSILMPLALHESREVRGKAYYELARLCARQKQFGPALLNFEAAWHFSPAAVASGEAMRFRARLHEKRGETKEAIEAYRLAHKLEPDDVDILTTLIRLEHTAGKTLDALDHLRRLVLAVKGDVSGLMTAAELYYQMERWDEAHEIALRAREVGFQGRVQKMLGLLHLRKQEYEQAVFHLERGDQDAVGLEALIQARLALGQLPEAFRVLEGVSRLAKVPASLRTWEDELLAMAKAHKKLKTDSPETSRAASFYLCADLAYRKKQAREQVERPLAKAMEAAELAPSYGLRALLHLERGALRKAAEDTERALRLGNGDARAFYVRGRMRLEKGEVGAVEDLKRAAALSEEADAAILHWLAAALHQAGRPQEALESQRKAVALRPGDPEIAKQLHFLKMTK